MMTTLGDVDGYFTCFPQFVKVLLVEACHL
jgi:hypothetical protein